MTCSRHSWILRDICAHFTTETDGLKSLASMNANIFDGLTSLLGMNAYKFVWSDRIPDNLL